MKANLHFIERIPKNAKLSLEAVNFLQEDLHGTFALCLQKMKNFL